MLPGLRPNGGCGMRLFAGVFITFWCGVTFTFDAAMGWSLAKQCWAYTFETAAGTITQSELKVEDGADDGKTYRLLVRYTYSANGQKLTGTRYRYLDMGTNDRTWHRIQQEFPVGKDVPVYYNAGDPAEAVLVRGPQGFDLFVFWFLTPFNVIAVGGLLYVLRGGRPAFVPADPRVIAMTDTGWQFRPGGRDGWVIFGGAMLALAFVGIFLIAFTMGFNPPLAVMAGVWIAALAFAAAMARRYSRRPVLEVDDFQQTVALLRGGRAFQTVPLADVTGFSVEVETKTDSDGDTTTLLHVVLRWGGPPRQTARFHSCSTRETAEAVARWLEQALKATDLSPPTP